jgi:hypothetical protein
MGLVACPHCGVEILDSSVFCEECGQAVAVEGAGPKVVGSKGVATSRIGRAVQRKQIKKELRKAVHALWAVGVINIVVGVIVFLFLRGQAPTTAATLLVASLIIGGLFLGLGFWARTNPLPPAIIGLVLYVSLVVFNIVMNPETATQGLAGLLIPILITIALINGVRGGAKYRELQRAEAGQ